MITIAHLSDTHLDGGEHAHRRAEQAVEFLRAAPGPIDVVLVTGDIADHGHRSEYLEAAALFADLPFPVLVLPGNHDVREAFRDVLLGQPPGPGEIDQVVRIAGVDFLLCDSTIPGEDGGRLSNGSLTWLDRTLAERDDGAPALICFHHPPVVLHTPYVDTIRQIDEERLAAVVRRHPRVAALLCGHAHTAASTVFAGLPLCVAPGIVSTVRMPIESGPTVDRTLPPALALHVLDDDRRLVTHFRPLPTDTGRPGPAPVPRPSTG